MEVLGIGFSLIPKKSFLLLKLSNIVMGWQQSSISEQAALQEKLHLSVM